MSDTRTPAEVHVDITTTITNPVTGFSATLCTQQTITVPPNWTPCDYAADSFANVAAAHSAHVRSAAVRHE